jgi:aspartyl-tRNA(Asn)/glutamyl-tRNA(Gln) amidotransferase subunit A
MSLNELGATHQDLVTVSATIEAALSAVDDDPYNAVIASLANRARERVKIVGKQLEQGKSLRLAGVPVVVKDNYLTFGAETTAASNMLKGFNAPYQSTVVERLEAEGAIMVAKANLDAFAHGSSTENSDFGPTTNPVDETRVPGGSSGGSAAAVAGNIAPVALGSDTGGSIRLPASFCGVVGYKPSYGLVSRSGVVAMASSTDVMGPLTKTVADTALILDIIAGQDRLDGTTIQRGSDDYTQTDSDKPLKIGVVKEFMGDGVNPEVKQVITNQLDALSNAGHELVDISLPSTELALACYYIVVPAEISSNLARYDGVRFGHHTDSAKSLEEFYKHSRSEGFGDEAKRRIMIGNYVLSSGYYDAYYKKAQQARTKLTNDFEAALDTVDILAGPVAPTPAFKFGENTQDPLQMYLADVLTVGASLAGLPAMSVPAGETKTAELPVGLQLIGRHNDDVTVLKAGRVIEEVNQ